MSMIRIERRKEELSEIPERGEAFPTRSGETCLDHLLVEEVVERLSRDGQEMVYIFGF